MKTPRRLHLLTVLAGGLAGLAATHAAPPSLRRKAREWGVVYDGEEEEETPPAPPTP